MNFYFYAKKQFVLSLKQRTNKKYIKKIKNLKIKSSLKYLVIYWTSNNIDI